MPNFTIFNHSNENIFPGHKGTNRKMYKLRYMVIIRSAIVENDVEYHNCHIVRLFISFKCVHMMLSSLKKNSRFYADVLRMVEWFRTTEPGEENTGKLKQSS